MIPILGRVKSTIQELILAEAVGVSAPPMVIDPVLKLHFPRLRDLRLNGTGKHSYTNSCFGRHREADFKLAVEKLDFGAFIAHHKKLSNLHLKWFRGGASS